jgi:hypothetical protein
VKGDNYVDLLAQQAGLKRFVENDDMLRARVAAYIRGQQGAATKDGIFFALRAALPSCGIVLVEEQLTPRPRFGFFARLFFRKLWRDLEAHYAPRLTIYIYPPGGTPPVDADALVREYMPLGVPYRIVLAGGDRQ